MSTACQLLVPDIYPQGMFVFARAQWVPEVRPDPSLEDGCCVKSCGCRGQEEIGVPLLLTVSPCDSVFFSPSSHVSNFSHSHTYSLLRFF
jgi:hypothetical protein